MRNLQFNGNFSGTLDLGNLSIPAAGTAQGRLTLELGTAQGVWDFIRMLQAAFPSAHTAHEYHEPEPAAIGLTPEPTAQLETKPLQPIAANVSVVPQNTPTPPPEPSLEPRRRGRKPGPKPGTPRPVGRGRKGASAT